MNENNKTVDYTQKVLDVKNLKKHFFVGVGKNKLRIPAVDDLTFSVYKREVFGLVGESGCGKTTTGRTLIKLYNATDGFVDLNGVRVVAGYESNINQIKKIKKEHNNQILALNENEFNIYKIKQKEKQQLKEIKYQQRILEQQFEGIKEEIEKPLSLHIDKLYDLKNQYRLDIEKLEFAFAQEKEKIEKQTQNSKVVEYKNEVAIATNTYNNKKSGLKDSAALNQETIKERLESLIQEHEEHLKELEEKYSVLIENEKSVIISKADAKEQIAKLKAELNQQLAARRVEYNEAVGAVVAPNKAEIASKTAEQKAIYNQKNSELVAQSAQIKEAIKQEIAQLQLVEYTKEQLNQIKQQKNEINAKMKVLVAEQKAKIAEIKQINRSQSANNAARKMQMIFQDPISSLNPRMTVKEIVGEGLVIQGNHTKEEIDRKVSEALKTVGLAPEYATRYPHEFSGGQRQRIGIARALIMNPNFIIADEPISALDVSIRAQVINLLTELKDELGLTILFIAHDLSVVRFFCDRIAVMFSGKIVELADSEELFNNPLHPYTVSLLSAIPQPDPHYEKGRKRISYNPSIHDYRNDKPELVEVNPGHFVYANKKELEEINQKLASSKVEDKPAQDETLEPKPAKAKPKPKAKTAPKKKQNNQ